MSRNKNYQHLLNSKRWKELRQEYLQSHPLCEQCLSEGYVTAAVDVHHITPVESAHCQADMEVLTFGWHNLKALCIPCHIKVHQEMRSHTKEAHKEREDDRLKQWIDRQKKKR